MTTQKQTLKTLDQLYSILNGIAEKQNICMATVKAENKNLNFEKSESAFDDRKQLDVIYNNLAVMLNNCEEQLKASYLNHKV